jgi:hypothetical protein
MNLADEVFYIFKNGQPINNELEYEENGTIANRNMAILDT